MLYSAQRIVKLAAYAALLLPVSSFVIPEGTPDGIYLHTETDGGELNTTRVGDLNAEASPLLPSAKLSRRTALPAFFAGFIRQAAGLKMMTWTLELLSEASAFLIFAFMGSWIAQNPGMAPDEDASRRNI